MITYPQAADLSKRLQINTTTVYREYLQLSFLNALYQQKGANKISFKGGTALRLLFGSPRFSEDLDFDTSYPQKEITKILKNLEIVLAKEFPEIKILRLYSGKNGIRFRLKLPVSDLKFPLIVRLDFTRVSKINAQTSVLETDFPVAILPLIYHAPAEYILHEKLLALTDREKGRDLFDILYLLRVKTPINTFNKKLLGIIQNYPQTKLEKDLRQFLPESQRNVLPQLKNLLLRELRPK